MKRIILLFQCEDRTGIVAAISDFIFRQNANIIDADQYSTDAAGGHFFMRVEFSLSGDSGIVERLAADFAPVAQRFGASWRLFDTDRRARAAILVSRPDHCLVELLYLWRTGELPLEIPMVISNHEGHRALVEQYGIPFRYIAASKADRKEHELLATVKGTTDLLILARYMLILSKSFLAKYRGEIINIHHGFLPSFKGADPYRQAFDQGVKVIGATAHFATDSLDEGPIIAQSVEHVSHKDDAGALRRKGRHLEQRALSTAVRDYLDRRIIIHNNKTIVF